jgi:hypothetical protein
MDLLETPIIYKNSGTKYRFLTGWLRERERDGIYLHPSLSLLYNPEWKYGIGAATTVALEKGTVVARIPKSLILSPRTVTNHLLRDILVARDMTGIVGLTIAYIFEVCRMEDSPFGGYLVTMTFPKVPRAWRREEKEILKGTEVDYSDALSLVYAFLISLMIERSQTCVQGVCQTIHSGISSNVWVWRRDDYREILYRGICHCR